MINGCEVHVAFEGDLVKVLSGVATELEKLGYEPKKASAKELKMSFAGKMITSDPNQMKHAVTVSPSGEGLSFKFGTGLIASSWSDADKAWAQARAQGVVDAIAS
ncbi:MAG: hypothetical protein AB8I08_01700 [Sandaracinaceae bacterium]